jgi:ABC-type glutathione transport system ATPase component
MAQIKHRILVASGRRKLVDIEDFSITENKITFLFGESGIGKSIISKAIFGLLDPEDLKITIDDQAYSKYLSSKTVKEIQAAGFFVFQEPSTHLNPLLRLSDQLNEGSLEGVSRKDEQSILKYLWKGADPDFLERLLKVFPKPYRPSGGEKQRILLVMAFKKIKKYLDDKNLNSALFIFDEPSGSLDNMYRDLFVQLLLECYRQKPFTAIIITHDYSVISTIEQEYKQLHSAIEYKELYRDNDNSISLSIFYKDDYLNWINNQSVEERQIDVDSPSVVKVKSGVRIFGKTLSFHKSSHKAPATVLELKKGVLTYLKAQSGVGKTTIAKIIMGLLRPDKLHMAYDKYLVTHDIKDSFWRKKIWGKLGSMIFQHADEALNQNASVLEIFRALPDFRKMSKAAVLKKVQELFDKKLPMSFLNKKVKYLSGGQKQRINILRSMVLNTDLLIMDEPLNGLDLKSAHKVIDKIKQHQAAGKAVFLISHNEEIFDRIIKKDNVYYLKAV